MTGEKRTIAGRECTLYASGRPRCLLIQPVDEHDLEGLDREVSLISASVEMPFALCAFRIDDWNRDLSPWDAPPVFGNVPFGHGAPETLLWMEEALLPELIALWEVPENIPVIPGGYSLAGFFALWSATGTDRFSAVACASPSVWFPGWMAYAETHPLRTRAVYLSLGDREEKTRNPVMARVGDCIRRLHQMLTGREMPAACILEWNEGNHFREPDVRTAKGFSWCMHQIGKERDPL